MKISGQTDEIVPKRRCLLVKLVSLLFSLFMAGQILAANPPVTVHLKGVTVAELLRQIESQGQYTFAYNNADIDLERVVSIDAEAWPVERVITTCIPNVEVLVERNKVILTPVRSAGAQQPRKISGKVVETNGTPVVGATVLYRDGSTVKGTTSSVDGEFAFEGLTPSAQATLEVSFIGYDTYRMPVGSRTFFDVKLATSQQSIDEVVVVGYGVQKKANLTGAVATVSQKELKDRPVANVGRALQGVIPNLNVTLSSGQPGSGASYNIRGTTSPNGGSPLILIDGVETYPERINSNDIESITVLKDASSAAIYGARGAFGVILITTKSGRYNEKAEVSYNGYFSVSSPTTSTDYETRGYYSAKIADFFMMSSQNTPYTSYTESDYRALWERRNDRTENPARPWVITDTRNGRKQYVYLANFDWYNYLYDDSRPTWDHNINIRGGTKSLSYMVSGRYYQQKGINRLAPDMFKSYNFRVKLQAEIRPWLTISSNTKFFQSNYRYYGYEDEYNNFRKPTLHALASFVPVNPDGTAVSHTSMTNSSSHYVMDGYNAMMQKGKSFGNKKTQEITTTFEATFKLHKNFNVKADFSYTQGYLHNDYRSVNVEYSQYPGEIQTEPEGNFPNSYKEVVWDQNYYVADVYGTYNKSFGGKHNFTAIAGYNYEAKYYRDLTAANDGLLSEDLSDFNLAKGTTNFTLNGGRNEYAIMGWFYRVAYDYEGKYLAEVNGRYDGTSRFPRGKRYGFFPLVLGGIPHQRGALLRAASQDDRQPQDPFLVRFAGQPADRLLRFHPDHHHEGFDGRLLVRRRHAGPARHGERPRLGQPDLGEGHLEEPRCGSQPLLEPPLADGRFLHPRHEGHSGQGAFAAVDLRCIRTAGQCQRPAHEGLRTLARVARFVQAGRQHVQLRHRRHAVRLHGPLHLVRQPLGADQRPLRGQALRRDLGLQGRRVVPHRRGGGRLRLADRPLDGDGRLLLGHGYLRQGGPGR